MCALGVCSRRVGAIDPEETSDTSSPLSTSKSSTVSHIRASTIPKRVTKTKKSVSGVFDCCVCEYVWFVY